MKPRVQLTRKFGKHQLQMRVFRDVGQLDFTDFVSTAQLADDIINGGNPDLRPQTEWAAEIEADLRFAGDAALRLRAFHHWLDDVVDFVPIGAPGALIDAPGNIGRGTIDGLELSLRLPLTAVLPGGTFTMGGTCPRHRRPGSADGPASPHQRLRRERDQGGAAPGPRAPRSSRGA